MKKKKSLRQLKKDLQKHFNLWIRERDKNICFTCGKPGNQAGHYIHSMGSILRYDPRNVNCQCASCNLYKHGNLAIYAVKLEEKYGVGILQEFDSVRKTVWKPTREELEQKISLCKLLKEGL